MRARMLLAMILAPTMGSVVYIALVTTGGPDSRGVADAQAWELILPAMLVGTLFEIFALLPLWHLFQPPHRHPRLLFVSFGVIAWSLCTAGLLLLSELHGAEMLVQAAQLFIPGAVLVLVFELLAGRETTGPAQLR